MVATVENTSVTAPNTTPLAEKDLCHIQWRNGDFLPAMVLDRRPLRRKTKTSNTASKRQKTMDKMEDWEYYVHYLHQDRRLDEWASADRFDLATLQRNRKSSNTAMGGAGENKNNSDNGADESSPFPLTSDDGVAPVAPLENSSGSGSEDRTSQQQNGKKQNRRRSSASHVSTSTTATDINSRSATVDRMLSGGNRSRSNDPALADLERDHEETTKIKNVEMIVFGQYRMDAWYYSPFPADYHGIKCLYVCEFCLAYFRKKSTLCKHKEVTCQAKAPPGNRIYHQPLDPDEENGATHLDVHEIDGSQHKLYCQMLCLLAKLFLDHKTLYFDVSLFYFYVVCKVDKEGSHIVGYFSKEKHSEMGYNLACILTFPPYQQSGFGKFIISCSYELSKREGVLGSPEKPLSDLGKLSYRSYWKYILLKALGSHDPKEQISIDTLSKTTGMKADDVLSTFQALEMISVWKGQHVVHVKQDMLQAYWAQDRKLRLCHPEYLTWTPPTQKNAGKEREKQS